MTAPDEPVPAPADASKPDAPRASEADAPKAAGSTESPAKRADEKPARQRGPRRVRVEELDPNDPLTPAIAALERGDHVEARRLATALRDHADTKVRERALALLDQLKPDAVILAVLAASALLIAILAALYLGRR